MINFYLASKGKSHLLIRKKISANQNIRRNTEDDEEEKLGISRESEINSLKDQIVMLSQEVKRLEKDSNENEKNADLLNELYQRGIIKEEGELIN